MEEKVFIKNSKGLMLCAVIHIPDKNKIYPAVILLHGFTGYKEEPHIEKLAKTLARNGFAAIRFDCSGSGDSDGILEKDYLMSNYLKDIEDVYSYISNLEYVDRNKIGIWGHSMGGELAVIFAASHSEIRACVAVSATTEMRLSQWAQNIINEWQKTGWFDKEYSKDGSQIKIPYSFIEDADKYNALDYVKKLTCPMLVILGTVDDVVVPENTKEIFNAANSPKELAEIEGMGHDYKKHQKYIIMVNNKILSFLKKYL